MELQSFQEWGDGGGCVNEWVAAETTARDGCVRDCVGECNILH